MDAQPADDLSDLPMGELVQDRPARWRPSPGLVKLGIVIVSLGSALGLGTIFQDRRIADAEVVETLPILASDKALEEGRYGSRAGGARLVARAGGSGSEPTPLEAVEAPAIPYRQGLKLVRNGGVDLEVDAYAEFEAALAARMKEVEGFLAGEAKQRLPNGKIESVLTLQIPPERFEGFVARLGELGTVLRQSVKTEDVTKAYVDLQARLKGKETLAERLKGVLANASGKVEELVAAEASLGATLEQIDQIKGELAYFDQLTRYSTLTLRVHEKHRERPFEIVESIRARLTLAARDLDAAFAAAQKAIADAGGQILEARSNDSEAFARARVDAPRLPALRAALLALGQAVEDAVERKKEPRGAADVPLSGPPLRSEPAQLELKITPPREALTRQVSLKLESAGVEASFEAARSAMSEAGAAVSEGGLSGPAGALSGLLRARVDVERLPGLLDRLRGLARVKEESVEQRLPDARGVLERAEVTLRIAGPEPIIAEENGAARALRTTLAGSWGGFLWSLERIFVGASLALPWLAIAGLAWLIWRRQRASASPAPSASSPASSS